LVIDAGQPGKMLLFYSGANNQVLSWSNGQKRYFKWAVLGARPKE